jgi:thiamine biosynthesis lipoprotein
MPEFLHQFHAMGTEVGLWLWHADEQVARTALADAEEFFAHTEARLSRFQPDSELSRLNRTAGQPFVASELLYRLVDSALRWRRRTDGIFDPTILNALLAHGYDRSFDTMPLAIEPKAAHPPANTPRSAHIELDRVRQSITLPAGVGLDLGGIAKGWTVQRVAQKLGRLGPALVDAGGDIVAAGTPPATEGWPVGVSHPHQPEADLATLILRDEAVATSSLARRRWQFGGETAHHLIDPRTGAPAKTDLVSVTVIAPRLPHAETYAKVALILGRQSGLAFLSAQPAVSAMLVTAAGRQLTTGIFEEKSYVYSPDFTESFINMV